MKPDTNNIGVKFHYCKECELLVFKWKSSVAYYGASYRTLNSDNLFEEEEDFDCRDTEIFEINCVECGEDIEDSTLEVPFDIAKYIITIIDKEEDSGIPLSEKNYKLLRSKRKRSARRFKEILMEDLLKYRIEKGD